MGANASGTVFDRLVAYENRDEECRIMAERVNAPEARLEFIRVAASYEKLASFARQEIALATS